MSAAAMSAGDWRPPRLAVAHTCCTCPLCVPDKPRFTMPALSDIEEPGPSYRIQAMSDQDDPSESTPTDAAPPLSEQSPPAVPRAPNMPTGTSTPSTMPPPPMTQDELDAEAEAIRASLTPAGIAKVAADKLIEMYQYSQRRDHDLLDEDGRLAKQQRFLLRSFKEEVVSELAIVVRDITSAAFTRISEQVNGLARGQSKHGEEIDGLKRDLAAMKDRMTVFEQRIQELDGRPAEAPPKPA